MFDPRRYTVPVAKYDDGVPDFQGTGVLKIKYATSPDVGGFVVQLPPTEKSERLKASKTFILP
jgi:hypothetical protein